MYSCCSPRCPLWHSACFPRACFLLKNQSSHFAETAYLQSLLLGDRNSISQGL